MTATHGHPQLGACGERLAFRRATPQEHLLDICVGGYIFTCRKHGQVDMEVFVTS